MSTRDELRNRMDPAYHSLTKREKLARLEAHSDSIGGGNLALTMSIRTLREDIEDDKYREAAQYPYIGDDGPVFFEREPAVRKRGEDGRAGAFVQAWVWVDGTEYRDEDGRAPYTPEQE